MQDETGRLDKYEIVQELGRGGFATVYRAVDTTLDREVALKVLDPLLMRDEAWVERFQREAKTIARLDDPHIVTILETGKAEDRLFIAMELVEGPSLDELIAERGGLSWKETLDVLDQVAGALSCAQGEGIVHGDLKPSDILIDRDRGAIVTDFGLTTLTATSSMSLSISGGALRGLAYAAPEVWAGKKPMPQTDVYALACIAYEMVTGDRLFACSTAAEGVRQHVIEGPQLPPEWPPGIPKTFIGALGKALTKEPEGRYGSASEFIAALREPTPSVHEDYRPTRARSAPEHFSGGRRAAGRLPAEAKAVRVALMPREPWQRLHIPLLVAGSVGLVALVGLLGKLSIGAYRARRAGVGPSPGGVVVGILADAVTIVVGLGLLVIGAIMVELMVRAVSLLSDFREDLSSLARIRDEGEETEEGRG